MQQERFWSYVSRLTFAISGTAVAAGYSPDVFITPMVISVAWLVLMRRQMAQISSLVALAALVLPILWNDPSESFWLARVMGATCVATSWWFHRFWTEYFHSQHWDDSQHWDETLRDQDSAHNRDGRLDRPEFDTDNRSLTDFDDYETTRMPTSVDHVQVMLDRLSGTGQLSKDQIELVQQYAVDVFDQDAATGFLKNESLLGTKIDQYTLTRMLGKGGSARVFLGVNEAGDQVAVKVLKDALQTRRFRQEIEIVETLAHPNIAVAYAGGVHDGRHYIVMEQLPGPDLHAHVRKHGPMTDVESAMVIRQAAAGLSHAHERGLVHRDVKPANLLWAGNNVIKVVDLGLAVNLGTGDGNPNDADAKNGRHEHSWQESIEKGIGGTPEYMAPEQAKQLSSATHLSDIFSLAATWQYLLTAKSRLPPISLRKKIEFVIDCDGQIPIEDGLLSPSLERVFKRAIASDPVDRFQSMKAFCDAIDDAFLQDKLMVNQDALLKVLIVEDDQVDLQATVRLLQKSNQSVKIDAAKSIADAKLALAANNEVDLVLLDLNLPDCSGVESVQKIRQCCSDVPIVVLTGNEDPAMVQACLAAGADDVVDKNDLSVHQLERVIFVTQSRVSRRSDSENT